MWSVIMKIVISLAVHFIAVENKCEWGIRMPGFMNASWDMSCHLGGPIDFVFISYLFACCLAHI